VPQYYVEGSHEAIISPEMHKFVQNEMKKRKATGLQYSAAGIFPGKLICADCEGYYGPKVWHSTSKYRNTIWCCNDKYKYSSSGKTPNLNDEKIKKTFIAACNEVVTNKDIIPFQGQFSVYAERFIE